jgi:predicted Rossmann-fold nucleotide-binding protein
VLIGSAYWRPVVAFLQQMVAEGMADHRDLDLALVTDDLDEAMQHIQRCTVERFGLRLHPVPEAAKERKLTPEAPAA